METLTFLLVVVGFLQVLVLLLQWWLIRRQDEHFRNSERAWIMAKLGWWHDDRQGLHVVLGAGSSAGEQTESTTAFLKLTCKNDGRSPAWIDQVYGGMDIVSGVSWRKADPPGKTSLRNYGPMDPLGAGQEASISLEMSCAGHFTDDEALSVYVLVEYRDIFGISRETTIGYSIDRSGGVYQQRGLPQRNRNT